MNAYLEEQKEQFDSAAHWEMERMQKMDAYIAIRGSNNVFENSDLPPEDMKRAMKSMKAVLDWRVKKDQVVYSALAITFYGSTGKDEQ